MVQTTKTKLQHVGELTDFVDGKVGNPGYEP
jgi:hypothetical protein